jgi:hypothetical protein
MAAESDPGETGPKGYLNGLSYDRTRCLASGVVDLGCQSINPLGLPNVQSQVTLLENPVGFLPLQ